MGWNTTNEKATILKDDKGKYKTSISTKVIQENGEEKTVFMRISVGFRKGVEVKNKTKIKVIDGFLSFYPIQTDETYENGQPVYKKIPKIMIMDFEVLEEGVDEVYQSKEYLTQTSNVSDDTFGGYYPEVAPDDLPF